MAARFFLSFCFAFLSSVVCSFSMTSGAFLSVCTVSLAGSYVLICCFLMLLIVFILELGLRFHLPTGLVRQCAAKFLA